MSEDVNASDDPDWRRRRERIRREVQARVGRGGRSAEDQALNEALFREWCEAGRPGEFLTWSHARRGSPI